MMMLNPRVLAGIADSLAIVFKAIQGGMFSPWRLLMSPAFIIGFENFFRIMQVVLSSAGEQHPTISL